MRARKRFGQHFLEPAWADKLVEAIGPRSTNLLRPDGSPLFAPTLRGGDAARLREILGGEELVELGWRVRDAGKTP